MNPEQLTLAELAVVIVNWNTAHLLDDCLQSVYDETSTLRTEIIVVDNNSSDGSIALLADSHPSVRVLPQTTNLGYQAACNVGTWATSAPLLLHINSDARLTPGALKAMIDVLADQPQVGIVGPRLVYGDGSFQRWTAGRLPDLGSLMHSFVLGDRFAGRGMWIDDDRVNGAEVGWVSSACLLVRAKTFSDVGGLDEQFFAYMDDVDLCDRASSFGWTTWYQPNATAIHFMGGSQQATGGVSATAVKSLVQWFRVRRGRAQGALAGGVMALGFALRGAAHLLRGRDRELAVTHLKSAGIALAAGATTT